MQIDKEDGMIVMGKVSLDVRKERDRLVRERISAGMLVVVDIARAVGPHPVYQGISMGAVISDIRSSFRRNGIAEVHKYKTGRGKAALQLQETGEVSFKDSSQPTVLHTDFDTLVL